MCMLDKIDQVLHSQKAPSIQTMHQDPDRIDWVIPIVRLRIGSNTVAWVPLRELARRLRVEPGTPASAGTAVQKPQLLRTASVDN